MQDNISERKKPLPTRVLVRLATTPEERAACQVLYRSVMEKVDYAELDPEVRGTMETDLPADYDRIYVEAFDEDGHGHLVFTTALSPMRTKRELYKKLHVDHYPLFHHLGDEAPLKGIWTGTTSSATFAGTKEEKAPWKGCFIAIQVAWYRAVLHHTDFEFVTHVHADEAGVVNYALGLGFGKYKIVRGKGGTFLGEGCSTIIYRYQLPAVIDELEKRLAQVQGFHCEYPCLDSADPAQRLLGRWWRD